LDKLKIYISKLFSSGVNAAIDAEQRRKVFLTNAISLSIVVFSLIILINDYFIVHNYLAGHRRLILIIALLSVPLFNKLGFHALAKSVLIISPGFAIIIIPVMVKDFFPGQLL
jgi:cytochrome c oxidase subunit IV